LAVRPSVHVGVAFDFSAEVQAGDQLVFLVKMHGNIGCDMTAFDPTMASADGERTPPPRNSAGTRAATAGVSAYP
jgi:hypothetical protein